MVDAVLIMVSVLLQLVATCQSGILSAANTVNYTCTGFPNPLSKSALVSRYNNNSALYVTIYQFPENQYTADMAGVSY